MEYEKYIHEIMLEFLRKNLSRDFKEIKINQEGEEKHAYKNHYPDMILGNCGMVLALLELETEKSINDKAVERWKGLAELGVKLMIMVPKEIKVKVTELLWSKGLMGKASIGTYELVVKMP